MPNSWDQIEADMCEGLRDLARAWRVWREAQPKLIGARLGADLFIRVWGEKEAALADEPGLPVNEESDVMPSLTRLRRMVRAFREASRACPVFSLSTESQAILKQFGRPGDDDGPPVLFDADELAYLDQLAKELDARSG